MKNLFFLSLFLFISLSDYAQTYNPFPKTNGYWKEQYGSVLCLDPWWTSDICITFQYILEGDTLINTNNYKKNFRSGRALENGNYFDDGYVGGLRDDTINKMVYYLEKDSANEVLLYDFNLNTGDVFNQTFYYENFNGYGSEDTFHIGVIDSILLDTHYAKRFHLLGAGDGNVYLIEGVGTTMGLFTNVYGYFEEHNDLLCFRNNDTIEYGGQCDFISGIEEVEERKISFFPNPVKSELTVSGYSPTLLKLCNTLGQIVAEVSKSNKLYVGNLPQGLYVLQVFDEKGQQVKTEKVIVAK